MRKDRFKINEELSVSDTVGKMTDDLFQQITEKIKTDKKYIDKTKNFLISKGILDFNIEKYLKNISFLKVYYVVYYLDSEEEYKVYDKHNLFNCSADYENKNIKINVGYIANSPSKETKQNIRHELKHIYEYDCGMQKNVSFYDVVVDRYNNGELWEKIVAWALYMSFKTEQDAFLSQYYEYLKTHKPHNIEVENDKNNPYNQFDKAFCSVDYLNFSDEQIKKSFGITRNQLYHILNSADERLFKKMCHVVQKFSDDEKKKNNIVEAQRMNFLLECYAKGITEQENDINY